MTGAPLWSCCCCCFFCRKIFLGCMWKSKNTSNDQMESLNDEPHFKCLQYTLEKRESILNVFHTISVRYVSKSRASWFKNINSFLMITPCQILMFRDNSYCWSKIELNKSPYFNFILNASFLLQQITSHTHKKKSSLISCDMDLGFYFYYNHFLL